MQDYLTFIAKTSQGAEGTREEYDELATRAEYANPEINQKLLGRIVDELGNIQVSLSVAAEMMCLKGGMEESLLDACARGRMPHELDQEGDVIVYLKDVLNPIRVEEFKRLYEK